MMFIFDQQLIWWVQLWTQVWPLGVESCTQVREVLAWERCPPEREELWAPQVSWSICCHEITHFLHCLLKHDLLLPWHFSKSRRTKLLKVHLVPILKGTKTVICHFLSTFATHTHIYTQHLDSMQPFMAWLDAAMEKSSFILDSQSVLSRYLPNALLLSAMSYTPNIMCLCFWSKDSDRQR